MRNAALPLRPSNTSKCSFPLLVRSKAAGASITQLLQDVRFAQHFHAFCNATIRLSVLDIEGWLKSQRLQRTTRLASKGVSSEEPPAITRYSPFVIFQTFFPSSKV